MKTGSLVKLLAEHRNLEPDPARNYIGASSIGSKCLRKLWYEYQLESENNKSQTMNRILNMGKILEGMLISELQSAGLHVTVGNDDNDYLFLSDSNLPYFQGHCDGIIDGKYILEIKTAKNEQFTQFIKHGYKKWNEQYYAQVQAYMGMSGLNKAFALVLNKNTGVVDDEMIEFEEDYYSQLKDRALFIHDSDIEPPKINGSPLYYVCRMCSYFFLYRT